MISKYGFFLVLSIGGAITVFAQAEIPRDTTYNVNAVYRGPPPHGVPSALK